MIPSLFYIVVFFLLNVHITIQAPTEAPYVEELYRFPNGTRAENLLVLRNGSILLTLASEPSLYRYDPKSPKKPPVFVNSVPGKTSLFDITQLDKNTVAVTAGNISGPLYSGYPNVSGTYSVVLFSLSGRLVRSFPIPQAGFLRGITTLPDSPNLLLIADPSLAIIWRLNTLTGAVDKPFDPSIFASRDAPTSILDSSPIANLSEKPPFLNGIHVLGQYLYFTNSIAITVNRVRITPNGSPAGDIQTRYLRYLYLNLSDFVLKADGSLIVTDPFGDSIFQVGPLDAPWNVTGILNGGAEHPNAVAFARRRSNILYVVTIGYFPEAIGTSRESEFNPSLAYQDAGTLGGSQVLRVNLDLVPFGLQPSAFPF